MLHTYFLNFSVLKSLKSDIHKNSKIPQKTARTTSTSTVNFGAFARGEKDYARGAEGMCFTKGEERERDC